MKYALFIGALMAASSCFAQDKDPLYNFNKTGDPKVVKTLGTNPEFPCLQNKRTPEEVLSAMRKVDRTEGRQKQKMDNLLMGAGFESGISDVRLSNISMVTLPDGTTGNMGGCGYNSSYTQLKGNENGYRAWKITSDNGSSVYFMAKCGNSFAMNSMDTKNNVACTQMPVTITSEPKVISQSAASVKERVETKESYVYYHKKGKNKHVTDEERMAMNETSDSHPSQPLLLRSVKKAKFVPQDYRVTVTPQADNVTVCNNKPVDVAANINVEYTSEYTGNYPNSTNKTYKKVSKHVYKKSMRKMRRAERKEQKVSRMTGIQVNK
ncbi:MAG: hypothetical protein JWQ38_1599 [Flavipsychrobacter sp.]|nr:hypothetical protein [Flavipsychrobacter sp.]